VSEADDISRARALFEKFHRRAPRGNELVRVGGTAAPYVALQVGICQSIGYRSIGDHVDYFHEFEGTKPSLYVNETGRQIFVLDGSYRFTERGFIK